MGAGERGEARGPAVTLRALGEGPGGSARRVGVRLNEAPAPLGTWGEKHVLGGEPVAH